MTGHRGHLIALVIPLAKDVIFCQEITKELSLNNSHISGRYPLPAKAQLFVLLRAAGSAPGNVEVISGQFLSYLPTGSPILPFTPAACTLMRQWHPLTRPTAPPNSRHDQVDQLHDKYAH